MATVTLTFSPLPYHVRTARLVAASVARRAGLDDDMLDELRLAVGEACSRAVALHARYAPDEAVALELSDERARFSVTVCDRGPTDPADEGAGDAADDVLARAAASAGEPGLDADPLPAGFGLAVIAGLVDSVEVVPVAGTGTRVLMSWPL